MRERVKKWAAAQAPDHMFFAVCLEKTLIGYVSLHRREEGHELGICFHSAYGGRGYAREAVLALMDYCRTLGISALTAGTAEKNLPSGRLLRAVGFEKTGSEPVSFYRDGAGEPIWFQGGLFRKEL